WVGVDVPNNPLFRAFTIAYIFAFVAKIHGRFVPSGKGCITRATGSKRFICLKVIFTINDDGVITSRFNLACRCKKSQGSYSKQKYTNCMQQKLSGHENLHISKY